MGPQREWWVPLCHRTPQTLAEDIRKNCEEEIENAARIKSQLENIARQEEEYINILLTYYKQALKGCPRKIARKKFTHSVYKRILIDAVNEREREIGHNSVIVNQIRYGTVDRTMVTLETCKTPMQLRDTKRFYLNAFYSVAYGHPLSYRLGYNVGDVLSCQGGYIRNTQHLIAPMPRQVQDIRTEGELHATRQGEEEEEESTDDDEELPYLL